MKAIGSILKTRRIAKGMTARQLAGIVGVSDAHIIYIEKGQRKATFDKLANIIRTLGLSVDEVLSGIGQEAPEAQGMDLRRLSQIPVVTWVTAGRWPDVCDAYEPGGDEEWIDSDVRGRNVFALRVTGDSMEPEFHDGEVLTVNPHAESLPGDFVVVKNSDGETTFKQLKRYGTKWVLHPLNPKYEDQVLKRGEFHIIGKVVKKEKRY
jgi:SOS-response transcriptional repressor LexA